MKDKTTSEGTGEISPELEFYIEFCKRLYERMEAENSWPWLNKLPDNG